MAGPFRSKIINFKIFCEKSWTLNLYGTTNHYNGYPQTFKIDTAGGKTILVTAAELDTSGEDKIQPLVDNLLITEIWS